MIDDTAIDIELMLRGYIIILEGYANNKILMNAENNDMEKFKLGAEFSDLKDGNLIHIFENEAELNKFWDDKDAHIKISLGKIPLPKIKFGTIFWPLSKDVQSEFEKYNKQNNDEKDFQLFQQKIAKLEEDDFKSVWYT